MKLKQWIVSLGDGTYVLLDELPTVMLVSAETLADPNWTPPLDCAETDHIHIKDLLTLSVWKNTGEVVHPRANLAE